ncbi:subtilisin-like protein [Roridomyces roridus]|uniref:tripeptidyl-peptidase II n=1 Tax=Roridomyces roridus TaxID=1738132 RepID=A0AAD7FIT3_9AGAR|nr:subtilisin-like protein [Roridomyces roridus]
MTPTRLALFLSLTRSVLSMVMHERISSVPPAFKLLGTPAPSQQIDLLVALVQSNMTGLEWVVEAVSTPSSPSYGQYLSADQVAQYVKPPAASVSTVLAWLGPNVASVTPYSPAGDILQVSLSIAQAEALFDTKFSTYTHMPSNGPPMIRAMNYSVPDVVQPHIQFVHPIVAFATRPRILAPFPQHVDDPRFNRRQLAPCEDIVRPVCLQEFYGLPNKTISSSADNKIGVQGYNDPSLGEYANLNDLSLFLGQFRPDIPATTSFQLVSLNGAKNLQDNSGGLEGQIDIQYTVGVAGGVPVTYLLDEGGDDAATSYMNTINWLLSQEHPPRVFTTSYGNEETDLTRSAATAVCNGYMQLAAMGISMIFASGDGGAADNQFGCTSFVPMFPPTCPYVTSVGGTFFQPPTAFQSSAGGFSNYFPVPRFQVADTQNYIKTAVHGAYSGMYNKSGRGFPDVAAEWEVYVVNAGGVTSIGGTSCASPIFASFIALVNDRLIAAGRPALGFLNPLLYSIGRAGLDDVVVGQSSGCSKSGTTGCVILGSPPDALTYKTNHRWNATTGWDPITGLGTPNFKGMLNALGLRD